MSKNSKIEEIKEDIKEDFLDVDKAIPGQNYCCISFVSPDKILARKEDYYFHEFSKKRFQSFQKDFNGKLETLMAMSVDGKVDLSALTELQQSFKVDTNKHVSQTFESFGDDLKDFKYANEEVIEAKFHEENNFQTSVRGVKIRGSYNTLREAQIRAKVLQRMDPSFHIFVGQIGYWLPWDPTADKVENQEYLNNQLNDMVKKYKVNEAKRDEFYEQQKQDKKKVSLKQIVETENSQSKGPKLAMGSESDPVVSMSETAANLNQADPWSARKSMLREMDDESQPSGAGDAPVQHHDGDSINNMEDVD
jgi:hypothetical protein